MYLMSIVNCILLLDFSAFQPFETSKEGVSAMETPLHCALKGFTPYVISSRFFGYIVYNLPGNL